MNYSFTAGNASIAGNITWNILLTYNDVHLCGPINYASLASPSVLDSPYVSSDETPPPTPGTHWGRGSPLFIDEGPESKTFPTLEQVFKALPRHIGFNIEVKYPVPEQNVSEH